MISNGRLAYFNDIQAANAYPKPRHLIVKAEDDSRLGRWVVCSAWPYVNDRPHLGTFTHLLSADVYARYLRLKGEDVVMVSGSDEHGAPIEVEALKRGISPRQLTDHYHQVFVDSLKTLTYSSTTTRG